MNIEKFNPKKDPKYIGYIFRFLKKKSKLRKMGTESRQDR